MKNRIIDTKKQRLNCEKHLKNKKNKSKTNKKQGNIVKIYNLRKIQLVIKSIVFTCTL